jgi:PAS domain S-box-containing protein
MGNVGALASAKAPTDFDSTAHAGEARPTPDEREARYRTIFEGARVALWDQDFSRVTAFLEGLRADGVSDLRAYFAAYPEELAKAVPLVHVRDVNDYAVELFEARDKDDLLGSLGATFLPETGPVFLEELIALWEGRSRFESEAVVQTLKGRRLSILITIAWAGARCENSLVSILDISKQKAIEHRLAALNNIAKLLSSDLDLERIVQTVTDSATKLSGARFGAFFYNVANQAGESYLLYTLSGAPREAFEKFGMPRNTAVFAATFEGTGIVRSDDIRKDPRYGKSAPHHGMPKGHLPVVSYLAVPVVSRTGEVIGGLFFGHDQPGVFTADAEEIVAGIASHAAIAIDNARLLRTVQSDAAQRREAEVAQLRLAAIVESSEDAIVSKDLNGVIASWNKGAERVFGYRADEVIGKPVTVLFPEDHLDEEPKILARIRSGQPIEHYETIRRRKDGSLIDVSLSVSPIKDPAGKIIGASKIARDISARKRNQESLARRMAEQTALYRFTDRLHRAQSLKDIYDAAFDTIGAALQCERAAILLFDAAKVMRFAAWRGLSDSYRAAAEGHSPWTADAVNPEPICIPDAEAADIPDVLKHAIKRENIGALSFIPLVVDGELIGKFMTYYDHPHLFTQAEADLALNAARQLAFGIHKKRAEEERYQNEERLRLATQTGKVGLWEWDIRANRLSWTDSLYGIHGVEKETFNATVEGFRELVHPEDYERVNAAVETALRGSAPYELEFRIQKPDGGISWVFANAIVLRDEQGPLRMLGASFDITERKLADAERALLLAELSHRVKNTLATVISIAQQSFSRGPSPDESLRSFQSRIRGLAQTHSRLAEKSWSGVSLDTIVADETMPYRREDGSNVRVSGPNIQLNAKCAVALGMAFHELATNAAKYGALSSKSGAVDIAWTIELPANRLRIQWTESGGPAVTTPNRSGFGRLLLERALASDLRGDVDLEFAERGLKCVIAFPLNELMASAN